jgi:TRAP-type uncharacterized transport system substrate-binding protein
MRLKRPIAASAAAWLGKGFFRFLLLMAAAAAVAAFAAGFGIAHDYSYLRASILAGSQGGKYYALATRLADRAAREHGTLRVIPTAGSIENVKRLTAGRGHSTEMFALIQDGTPVSANARLELLGRLPQPESLLLLGRQGQTFRNFSDLRGASIGIGPDGSGTAYLMHRLFEDTDLRELEAHLSNHELQQQAQLVGEGKLDLAAFVMQEDAEFLHDGLDVVSPQDLQGLIARYPWLSLGRIPAGRYDLVRAIPAVDKQVAQLATLLIANSCARRADRVGAPRFHPRQSPELNELGHGINAGTFSPAFLSCRRTRDCRSILPVAGEPPGAGILGLPFHGRDSSFSGLKTFSRYRLWRIDAARENLETALKGLVDPKLTHAQIREIPAKGVMVGSEKRAAAEAIMDRLVELRARLSAPYQFSRHPHGR